MKFKRPNKLGILVIAAIVIAVCVIAVVAIVQGLNTKNHQATNADAPKYPTVLPVDKSIDKLGGWQRISPAGSDPVYAYTDTIDGVLVSVSQQQLPAALQQDTDAQIADLAKAKSYTDVLTADGTKIYLGISAKGPQSVLFTKNGLLIAIKSQKKIADQSWLKYVTSLK